jgi:uncharacterized protein (DUF2235 family)
MKIGEAYKLYRSKVKPNDPQMIEFRQKYCIPHQENDNRPFITLLTCWDTVGALGIPNFNSLPSITKTVNKKYQFHDTKLSKIIQNALHAVAIDEERVAFEVTLMQKSDHLPNQQLWQKWFPGDHGCVGGGSQEHSGLSDGALQWIIDSITDLKLGLAINPALIPTGINPKPESVYNDSDMIGKITKSLGKKVREVSDEIDDFHESVVQRWKLVSNYRPENLKSKHGALLDFYIKACLFAIDNQIDDACDNLQKAIKINKNKFINWLKSDSDLEKIRSDERFQNLSK